MAKEQSDDEVDIRRKARRRLIGAAALTLAVVVVLPMVLDSEPKPSGKDIDLRIPSPDKVGEFVPGVAVSEQAVSAAQSAVAATPALPSAAAIAGPATTITAVEHTQPQGKSQFIEPAKEQPAAAKPPETQKPLEANKPQKTAGADKSASAEAYVLQVAAYSSASAAKQEFDRLKKWNFKVYTEKAGGVIRVRVGPYAGRDKAEKVGQLLEKHGLHPVIIGAK